MSSDRIPMTRAGYDKLKGEADQLEIVEMPKLAQRVAAARSEGDLSENAEYHGARESQGMMQAKINVLRDKLARAVIVERAKEAGDEVVFGATVVVKDLKFGDEEIFVLVGAGEEAAHHERCGVPQRGEGGGGVDPGRAAADGEAALNAHRHAEGLLLLGG
jgi:transcription elongation factor GreA